MSRYKILLFILLLFSISSNSQIKINIKDSVSNVNLKDVNVVNIINSYGSFSNEYGEIVIPKGIYGDFVISIVGYETIVKTFTKDIEFELKMVRKFIADSVVLVKALQYGKTIKVGKIRGNAKKNHVTPFKGKYIFADYISIDSEKMGVVQSLKFKFEHANFDYNNDLVEINFYGVNAEETYLEKLNDDPIYYQLKNRNKEIFVDLKHLNLKANYPNLVITLKVLHAAIDSSKRYYLLLLRETDKPFPNIVTSKINISSLLKSSDNLKVKTEIKIKTYANK